MVAHKAAFGNQLGNPPVRRWRFHLTDSESVVGFALMLVQQSLQKNQAFFLQGLLFLSPKAVFWPTIGILAEKRGISSARISAPPLCRVPPASGGTVRGRATAQGSPRSPRWGTIRHIGTYGTKRSAHNKRFYNQYWCFAIVADRGLLSDTEFLFAHTKMQNTEFNQLIFSVLQNSPEEQKFIRVADWGRYFCKETHKICKNSLFFEFLAYLHFVAW